MSSKLARRHELIELLILNSNAKGVFDITELLSRTNIMLALSCRSLLFLRYTDMVPNTTKVPSNTTKKQSNFRKLRNDSKIKISAAVMEGRGIWSILHIQITALSINSWARKML